MTHRPIRYLPTMFATGMLFMMLYGLCVALSWLLPGLPGHALLESLIPGPTLRNVPKVLYGMVMSGVYGCLIASMYAFFHNLWLNLVQMMFRVGRD